MEKATIFDYVRMCSAPKYDTQPECRNCPLSSYNNCLGEPCGKFLRDHPDKANEIILKWCKEHPIKTRQDRFLKMFPNAKRDNYGTIKFCPKKINIRFVCNRLKACEDCRKEYWLAEVDENE